MFFFSSRRRHTRCLSDWSSDVCSSDLDLYQVSAYANTSGQVLGVEPNYSEVRFLPLAEGRFIDATDLAERRRVVVLGSKNSLLLFLGHPILGETITINDIAFKVVGRAEPV